MLTVGLRAQIIPFCTTFVITLIERGAAQIGGSGVCRLV